MAPIMEIKKASFSYGDKEVFNNLNLEVKEGEMLCLVGPNGCGTTTLIECILGIQKLISGNVYVEGEDILKISHSIRAEKVAYIPQNMEKTFPYTVKDIVIMGRAHKIKMFAAPSTEDESIAIEAMEKMGISYLKEKPFTQIRGKVEITTEDGYITAGELLKLTDVEIIEGLNGEKINPDEKIKLGEKIKAVFLYNSRVLLVYKKYDEDLKEEVWHTIIREHYVKY